jgi:hypothetical protein
MLPSNQEMIMIQMRLGFLIPVFLLYAPCAMAQGTSQQTGVRSGYGGTGSPVATSPSSTSSPTVSPSRNPVGAGQSRSEGAYGLTPQLQKELGISRQQ